MIRLLGLNVNSPSLRRAKLQANALVADSPDVMVLTEMKHGGGGRFIIDSLIDHDYVIAGWPEEPFTGFTTVVASKVPIKRSTAIQPPDRTQVVTFDTRPHPLVLLGAYGPSTDPFNRSPAQKISHKRQWLGEFLQRIGSMERSETALMVLGDLNIVDGRRCPQYSALYEFERRAYSQILELGLIDLLRDTQDFSWHTAQGHGFRYDHAFASRRAADSVLQAGYDQAWRAGTPRLTDHAGLVASLALDFEAQTNTVREATPF